MKSSRLAVDPDNRMGVRRGVTQSIFVCLSDIIVDAPRAPRRELHAVENKLFRSVNAGFRRKGREWPLVVIRFQRSLTVATGPKQEDSVLSGPVVNIALSFLDVGIDLVSKNFVKCISVLSRYK